MSLQSRGASETNACTMHGGVDVRHEFPNDWWRWVRRHQLCSAVVQQDLRQRHWPFPHGLGEPATTTNRTTHDTAVSKYDAAPKRHIGCFDAPASQEHHTRPCRGHSRHWKHGCILASANSVNTHAPLQHRQTVTDGWIKTHDTKSPTRSSSPSFPGATRTAVGATAKQSFTAPTPWHQSKVNKLHRRDTTSSQQLTVGRGHVSEEHSAKEAVGHRCCEGLAAK